LYARWVPITGLKVNVTSLNGSFSGLLDGYNYGDTVTLTAVPSEGYVFLNWADKQGNILSSNPAYSFNISDNIELYANFTDMCDINRDGEINLLDLAAMAKNYNTTSTETEWDSLFDFNKDGVIDLFDLVICSKKM
jgi:hypothetical protein